MSCSCGLCAKGSVLMPLPSLLPSPLSLWSPPWWSLMLSLWNTGNRGPDPSTRSSPGASLGGVISVSCIRVIEDVSEGVSEGVSEDVLEEDQVLSRRLSWRSHN